MEGAKSTSIGKSSSLPASISKISTIFEKSEKNQKFCVGPTALRPGPILLIVVSVAVKLVVESYPLKERRNTDTAKSDR